MTNRHVNAIADRLSLRPPQRRSLEMLDRVTEIASPKFQWPSTAIADNMTLKGLVQKYGS